MAKARFKCTEDNFYDAAGTQHREYIDRNGNAFETTGLGSGEANDALNQCARANLGGDAIPPVNWLKVMAVGVVLLVLASIPWAYWRIRDPNAEATP